MPQENPTVWFRRLACPARQLTVPSKPSLLDNSTGWKQQTTTLTSNRGLSGRYMWDSQTNTSG